MKVETPQILWHNTQNGSNKENGKSFPILSCHLVDDAANNVAVLATAGGSEINLWKVGCTPDSVRVAKGESKILVKPATYSAAGVAGATPAAADAQHTAIQHLVTLSRSTNERTINCVRFSPDRSHLAAVGDGGLVVVWSLPSSNGNTSARARLAEWASLIEEKSLKFKIIYNQSDDVMDLSWYDSARFAICSLDHTVAVFESTKGSGEAIEWRTAWRSSKDHSHYVQGVVADPKGVYLASQGSDRTVKVYARKAKSEEELAKKFELGKPKTLKFLNDGNNKVAGEEEKREKRYLFADELTVGSFFRRLGFTPDGGFLIVPAGLWHGEESAGGSEVPSSPKGVDALSEASFGTYLFARHCYERPWKVLAGLEKPSVVVRPNPLLFQLPPNSTNNTTLPYRSIFAVLTIDTVLIYDTHHDQPLAVARGLHYAGLTDAAWSADGRTLFVTSSDGYVSILSFAKGELGEVYVDASAEKQTDSLVDENVVTATSTAPSSNSTSTGNVMPQSAINILAPKKKKKVTLNLEANVTTEIENVSNAPSPVIVNTLVPKKKKKISPTPVMDVAGNIESNKRLSEDAESKEQVNVLVPKKKAKVCLTPVEASN